VDGHYSLSARFIISRRSTGRAPPFPWNGLLHEYLRAFDLTCPLAGPSSAGTLQKNDRWGGRTLVAFGSKGKKEPAPASRLLPSPLWRDGHLQSTEEVETRRRLNTWVRRARGSPVCWKTSSPFPHCRRLLLPRTAAARADPFPAPPGRWLPEICPTFTWFFLPLPPPRSDPAAAARTAQALRPGVTRRRPPRPGSGWGNFDVGQQVPPPPPDVVSRNSENPNDPARWWRPTRRGARSRAVEKKAGQGQSGSRGLSKKAASPKPKQKAGGPRPA